MASIHFSFTDTLGTFLQAFECLLGVGRCQGGKPSNTHRSSPFPPAPSWCLVMYPFNLSNGAVSPLSTHLILKSSTLIATQTAGSFYSSSFLSNPSQTVNLRLTVTYPPPCLFSSPSVEYLQCCTELGY